jgi:hypothetical protein
MTGNQGVSSGVHDDWRVRPTLPLVGEGAATSVGAAGIERWLRPVTYQSMLAEMLAEALRDDNPLGIPHALMGCVASRSEHHSLWPAASLRQLLRLSRLVDQSIPGNGSSSELST